MLSSKLRDALIIRIFYARHVHFETDCVTAAQAHPKLLILDFWYQQKASM